MVLLKTSRSATSIDVGSDRYGNVARFFSGINNYDANSKKLQNVGTIRFLYKGLIRIIFYSKRNI